MSINKNILKIENTIYSKKNSISFLLILFLWTLSSFLFYFYVKERYGVPPIYGEIDWERYKNGALSVLQFNLPEFPGRYYVSYCLYLALNINFYFPYSSLVSNLLLNLFSAFLIYKIAENIFDPWSSIICTCLFLFYPFIQMWVFFIQPVSFFSFSILLLTYSLTKNKSNIFNIFLIIFASIVTLLARPHGIAFMISFFIFILLNNKNQNKKLIYPLYLIWLIFLFFYLIYLGNGNIIPIYESWKMEDLKQFGFTLPTINHESLKNCTNLTEHEIQNFSRENSPKTSIGFWACSFFYNPIDVVKIFTYRIFAILSYYKPTFSFKHNLFSLFSLFPIYIFFIISIIKFYNLKINFILSSIILLLLSSCITIVDGDNRVYSAVLPLIFIVASGSISYYFKKYIIKTI